MGLGLEKTNENADRSVKIRTRLHPNFLDCQMKMRYVGMTTFYFAHLRSSLSSRDRSVQKNTPSDGVAKLSSSLFQRSKAK